MGYRLADHLSYCTIGETVIFLDLQSDRYFCLGENAGAAFDGLLRGLTPSTGIASDLERLEAAHVIQQYAGKTMISPVIAAPAESEVDRVEARVGSSDMLAAFYHAGKAGLYLKSHSLLDTITRFQASKARAGDKGATLSNVRKIAQAHSRLKRIMPSTDRCLQRSLALANHLAAKHIPASLIFGVTLAPFSAHCWVQYDALVLNDHVDYVAQRTPILVL